MADILLEECKKYSYWEEALHTGAIIKEIPQGILNKISNPEYRAEEIFEKAVLEQYTIGIPDVQQIPKDKPGEFREVFINSGQDRIFLSVITNALFTITLKAGGWVSPHCLSYQKGIGTGKIVVKVSKWIIHDSKKIFRRKRFEELNRKQRRQIKKGRKIGAKADLSKYFDSVPIEFIDTIFDRFEREFGKSCIITILRKYYHQDTCYIDGKLVHRYQSLKQGCAVASWLADVLLYDMDEEMNKICNGQYVRYSDDILFVCKNHEYALGYLKARLMSFGLTLNPKKVESVYENGWITFLGFSIKGSKITISRKRLEKLREQIKEVTLKKKISMKGAVNAVNRILYIGNGEYSWATSILPIVNCEEDLITINKFLMDCIKSCKTNHKDIAGIGYEPYDEGVVIYRPNSNKTFELKDGKKIRNRYGNSNYNKKKVKHIENYYSPLCMQKNLKTHPELYKAIVREMEVNAGIAA